MKTFLAYSAYLHLSLLILMFIFARGAFTSKRPEKVYIDFIGPSVVANIGKETKTAAPAEKIVSQTPPKIAPAPLQDDSYISKGNTALPAPSVLAGAKDLLASDTDSQAQAAAPGAPILADFANFPYPWYITQVREALWNAWPEQQGKDLLRCTLRFFIQRNGTVKGISVTNSSGNKMFDFAAMSAIEKALPFPRLPEDYYEDELTVNVEFKSK